jgi:ATP-dependent Clp protease ATP-binding subunit ClpB
MTSNIGAHHLLDGISKDGVISAAARSRVESDLRQHFRPEFLNRVDDIVFFKPLTKNEIGSIAEIALAEVRKRLVHRNISIEVTKAAMHHIVEAGYDPVYGARPLKRYIQREVETKIGRQMVAGQVPDGSGLTVDFKNGALVCESHRTRSRETQ